MVSIGNFRNQQFFLGATNRNTPTAKGKPQVNTGEKLVQTNYQRGKKQNNADLEKLRKETEFKPDPEIEKHFEEEKRRMEEAEMEYFLRYDPRTLR